MSVQTTASYQEGGNGMVMVCATLSGAGAIEAPISITLATSDSIPGQMHAKQNYVLWLILSHDLQPCNQGPLLFC